MKNVFKLRKIKFQFILINEFVYFLMTGEKKFIFTIFQNMFI